MTRPSFLIALALFRVVPSVCETPQDRIDKLALELQKGDARAALELFDPHAPAFAEIKRNIEALSALPNTTCAIAIKQTSRRGDTFVFETDLSLQTFPRQNGPMLDRRDSLEISLRFIDNTWKIVALTPVSALTPPDDSIYRRIADLATNLNEKNQTDALGAFDSRMKQFGEIDNDVDALVTQNDVLCAIDIVGDRQTGPIHTLDLDWYLQLKSRTDAGPVVQRRERVQVTLEQIRGKWKISSIEPLGILSPLISQ